MKEPKLRFKADDGAKFPDWGKNKFSDVFDSINNSTFSRDCLNYVDGNVKYIHYGDILTTFDSTVNVEASNVPYVNKDIDCLKYQLLADGDIIVADTAEDDTVGKAVEIVNVSNVKVISGLHTIACRPKLKFTSGYLGYYMNSNSYHNQLHPYMQGIKVTSISKANIALTNISIPSLPEQQKIASLFTELDTLIQSAKKELEGYRELKQGMLQKMFPKKGENVPEIRFPEFTGNWKQCQISEMFKITRGYVLPVTETSKETSIEMPYPVYSSQTKDNGLMGYYGNYLYEDAITWTTDGANAGTVNYRAGKFYCTNVCGVLLSDKMETSKAIAEALNIVAKKYVSYVGNPKLMNNVMAEIQIAVPPTKEERDKISSYFESLDNLIALQQEELDGYKELKKGLLQQMFC